MPIHVFWGNDNASIERTIEKMINEIIDHLWTSINLSRLDGGDSNNVNQALEEIRTPPLGTGGRIVLLRKSPFLNGCSSELAGSFERSISLIPDKTHLILINANKPDARLKPTKAIRKLIANNQASERSFQLPAVWDGIGQKDLVERMAKDLDIHLEPEATSLLVESIGNDSSRILSELEKLTLYEQAQKKNEGSEAKQVFISAETVRALVNGIATNALEIGNSLLNENIGKAIFHIDELLDSGEPALRILATLTGQVRGWLWISLLDSKGEKDVAVIAKAAGIANPKRIYIMRKQIQGRNPKQFLDLLTCLLNIEVLLKRGISQKDAFRDGLIIQKSLNRSNCSI